ncbi:MAG: winged helix-turn-helix transcriptional regulator [Dehalococcoidia bacterium]|nr:winged helix-turn-helix transcriptional regulator [Dehalococcoidia bacterium]
MVATNLHMQSTRQQILEYLQRHGRGTVKELGQLLGLTSTGIRQHLTVLERDALVAAHEERGRVGRPTLVYSLTERADALFPKTYDTLATALLEEIRATDGNEKLYQLLQRSAQRLAAPHQERVDGRPLGERVQETALIMEEQGCLVEWSEGEDAFYIDEFTCPFPKTAERDRAVCALHVEFVRLLTGADTRLTRSLMRGERACTYRIRPAARPAEPAGAA